MKRIKKIPKLMQQFARDRESEILEHTTLLAFERGVATEHHMQVLKDMVNMMMIGATMQEDLAMKEKMDAAGAVVHNIRARQSRVGKLGVSGQELDTIRQVLRDYDAWCAAQLPSFKRAVEMELDLFYLEQENGVEHE